MDKLLLFRVRSSGTARVVFGHVSCLTLLCLLLLSACALPKVGGIGITLPTGEASADPADATPAAPADTPTGAPAARPDRSSPAGITELVSADFTGPDAQPLQDLILFTSLADQPFAEFDLGAGGLSDPQQRLWAVSPDGQRAGRISSHGQSSAIHLPESDPGKVLLLTSGLGAGHESLELVSPPEECAGDDACGEYSFGAGGRTLAYYSGPPGCGRSLTLVDRMLGQTIETWSNVHWYHFLENGSLILSLDECEGDPRYIYQYIPNSDRQAGLSPEGDMIWNPSHQAVLMNINNQPGVSSGLWGINLQTSRVFLWVADKGIVNDSPVWLPDGQHFVYQHRAVHFDATSGGAVLEGPRQIILMNAWTRSQRLLAYDGQYDYHLCETPGQPCDLRYGDWLKVRRTPFRSVGFPVDEMNDLPEVRCALYGLDCQEQPEEMAINWKTGEMLPWSEASLVEVDLPPAFEPPDLTGQPIYSDPGGEFAFYTGTGGRTLWYVPDDGDPVLWVGEGENFVYLP